MPILIGPHINKTVADVTSRARSLLNDDNAQIWTDAVLMNAVRDSYTWLYNQVVKMQTPGFRVMILDLPYTPAPAPPGPGPGYEEDLAAILPVDIYKPIAVEFRLNSGEGYVEIERKQKLPDRTTQPSQRLLEWEYRGQTIIVNGAQSSGLIKLTYMPLLGQVNAAADLILIDNAIEAIAYMAASICSVRRGQYQAAGFLRGSVDPSTGIGTGAVGYAAAILDHIILDEQQNPRRGGRYAESNLDAVSNRQSQG